jgi:hypothetical protein
MTGPEPVAGVSTYSLISSIRSVDEARAVALDHRHPRIKHLRRDPHSLEPGAVDRAVDFADLLLERPAFGAQLGNSLQLLPKFDQGGIQGRAVPEPRIEVSNERKRR